MWKGRMGLDEGTMKRVGVCVILLSMPIRSVVFAQVTRPNATPSLAEQPAVRAALEWFEKNLKWINDEQGRLTEIPAPSFQEEKRAVAVKALLADEGLKVHSDKIGNVIGELPGANEKEIVMVAAGISDNGTGLAALVALARAMRAGKIRPQRTILFAANVGEEGEGNLRGMRAMIDVYRTKLRAVVVLDGSGTDFVTTKALASRRLEVT